MTGEVVLTTLLSQVWLDVVERASKFLRQVVCGEVSSSSPGPPVEDRHLALALLCELAVQRAHLSEMLSLVLLLLSLWRLGATEDNRHSEAGAASAPLVPLLRRLDQVESEVRHGSQQPTELRRPCTGLYPSGAGFNCAFLQSKTSRQRCAFW